MIVMRVDGRAIVAFADGIDRVTVSERSLWSFAFSKIWTGIVLSVSPKANVSVPVVVT